MAKEFTFDVAFVLDYLGVAHPGRGFGDAAYIDCPVCHGKRKMQVVYSKNLVRCNKCGAGGGMLALAKEMLGVESRSEAARILGAAQGSTSFRCVPQPSEDPRKYQGWEAQYKAKTLSVEVRDHTYTHYLHYLTLSDDHFQQLTKVRGLTPPQIEAFGFKSVPMMGKRTIPEALQDEGCRLLGVPLFYQKDGCVLENLGQGKGFYIPVRDLGGRILGLQIRLDEGKTRYIWVTSWSDRYLMKAGSNLAGIPKFHHVGFAEARKAGTVPVFGLTEGPLKADICTSLGYPYPMIALCGLSNQLGLYEELKRLRDEYGLKTVQDFTDMDKFALPRPGEKNYVKEHCDTICRKIRELGLRIERYSWDQRYKGFDDFLLALKRGNADEKSLQVWQR
ncbi:MAG: DUF3854 domain-containing protein [Lachnospiraceae bacterium]|nr:DUF3854 domain-containing protein [Lachnospiraceae bacterium]